MTTVIYDDIYLKHDSGAGHPENATRIINTIEHLLNFKKCLPTFDENHP